jgi:hypothetical protein
MSGCDHRHVCGCDHRHTCVRAHTHTHTHTHTHRYAHTHTHTYAYTHTYTHMRMRMQTKTHTLTKLSHSLSLVKLLNSCSKIAELVVHLRLPLISALLFVPRHFREKIITTATSIRPGIESGIFCSVGRRLIHWANKPLSGQAREICRCRLLLTSLVNRLGQHCY